MKRTHFKQEDLQVTLVSSFVDITVSYDEIKQKVITQANDYHRVKAYTP